MTRKDILTLLPTSCEDTVVKIDLILFHSQLEGIHNLHLSAILGSKQSTDD